jgi:hypothetical protein
MSNYADEIPLLTKKLGYPGSVKKSWLITGMLLPNLRVNQGHITNSGPDIIGWNEFHQPISWYLFYAPFANSILFHGHVQNATIPFCSQELLPFLPVVYFFLPIFSRN